MSQTRFFFRVVLYPHLVFYSGTVVFVKVQQNSKNCVNECLVVGRVFCLEGDVYSIRVLHKREPYKLNEKKAPKKRLNHTQHIVEVILTSTVIKVTAECLIKPAFIIHKKLVDNKTFLIQGRSDFLMVECEENSDIIDVKSWEPFCKEKYNNLALDIFLGINNIQNEIRKLMLGQKKEIANIQKRNTNLYISNSCWYYIFNFLNNNLININTNILTKTPNFCTLTSGFNVETIKIEKQYQFLRLEEDKDLFSLLQLFGETTLCGINRKRPRVCEGQVFVQENDIINIVQQLPDYQKPSGKLKIRSNQPGIDLKYCEDDGELKIQVRFLSFVFKEKEFYENNNCGLLYCLLQSRNILDWKKIFIKKTKEPDVCIYIGEKLKIDNQVWKIVEIAEDHVFAERKKVKIKLLNLTEIKTKIIEYNQL